MQLSSEHNSALRSHFSAMAKSYGVTPSDIVTGFNPDGDVLPVFFNAGLSNLSHSEKYPFTDINIVMVEDRHGEGFLWAGGEPCTGRTDMEIKDRETSSLVSNPSSYKTKETQCDVHIPFGIISKWSVSARNKKYEKDKRKTFSQKYGQFVQNRVCMDVLNIGFNGVSSESSTTPKSKLTDVNKGWIQVVKEQKPEQVIDKVFKMDPKGTIPDSYRNLDSAVADIVDQCIDISLREGLVCIISDNLISYERHNFYQNSDFIIEKKNTSDTFEHFGGLDRVRVPNFPDNTIVVTALDNLSLYIKESTTYRQIEINPKRNRVEDYQHREEAYVVENMAQFGALINLTPIEDPK